MNGLFYEKMLSKDYFKSEDLLKIIFNINSILKHDLKTGIIAQMRMFEYIISKYSDCEDNELIKLLEMCYETSKTQYKLLVEELEELRKITVNSNECIINLDIDLCLT